MTAMPTNTEPERFDLLEMDNYHSDRTQEPAEDDAATRFELLEMDTAPEPRVTRAPGPKAVQVEPPQTQEDVVPQFGVAPDETPATDLVSNLVAIGSEGAANASVQGASLVDGGAELPFVGFRTQDGYIAAIRNGVKAATHVEYLRILRETYRLSGTALAKLNLPGPMAETVLPESPGIVHMPTGPSVFDRPRAQRAFVIAPKAEVERAPNVSMSARELVAGAAAEGHHAIIAWEGTSGMLRGELVAALTEIGRQDWAPKAPNARAQAGSAIAGLGKAGLHVKALRKGSSVAGADLASGEHIWTVGRVDHMSQIGAKYGECIVRFKLSGAELTFDGEAILANPVIADFQARMSSELFKSSDITGWLSRTLRDKLDGVRFGALGWLVPARHVAAAKQLTEAVGHAGFGLGWVHGLPVATSDQLRDGIVRGLLAEVTDVLDALRDERAKAKAALESAEFELNRRRLVGELVGAELDSARGALPAGDIGQTRAATHLKELKAIAARVVAYGQVLGEDRVKLAQDQIRDAMTELESVLGEDYSGIRQRFGLIWEEIERDRKLAGGVL